MLFALTQSNSDCGKELPKNTTMHSSNRWGGSFDIQHDSHADDVQSSNMAIDKAALLREQLDETQQGWLLGPRDVKKDKYIDLWIVVCKKEMVKWVVYSLLIAFVVIGVPIIVAKMMPTHKEPVLLPDEYTVALRLALEFFNAQKCKPLILFFCSFPPFN